MRSHANAGIGRGSAEWRLRRAVLAGLVFLVARVLPGWAADVPRWLHYQGFMEHEGERFTDFLTLRFEVFDGPAGGAVLYAETLPVMVEEGYYAVRLGNSPDASAPYTDLSQAIRAATAGAWLQVSREGAPIAPRKPISAAAYTVHARDLHVDTHGRLGIGTQTPAEKLHVSAEGSDAVIFIEATHETNWVDAGLRMQNPRVRWDLRMDGHGATQLPAGALGLRAHSVGREVMTWTPEGNVGIGRVTPDARLDVQGEARVTGRYRYAPAKIHSRYVYASDFASAQNYQQYYNLFTPFGAIMHTNVTGHSGWRGECVLHLPHGARLESVLVDLRDRCTVQLDFKRRPHASHQFSENMIPAHLVPGGGSFFALSPSSRSNRTLRFFTEPIIDNENYIYLLSVNWSSSTISGIPSFYGLYFEYTIEELTP